MKEKTLLKIALTCSIIGIVFLFVIFNNIDVKHSDISKIQDEEDIGNIVKIYGKVIRASDTGKVLFLEIGQEKIERIDVVVFKEEDINISEGEHVEIIGEVEEYKGKKEIIANKVSIA